MQKHAKGKKQYSENMENFEAFLENMHLLFLKSVDLKGFIFLVGDFCTNPQTLTPFPFFKED